MKVKKRKILIVGAGVAGRELLAELKKKLNNYYDVVGLIDDDISKRGRVISGIRVLGTTAGLEKIIKKNQIQEIFVALPSAEGETIKRIIEACSRQKIVFKIVPRILEIILGKVKLGQIREVKIEDLLGRPIIRSEQKKFLDFFKDKKILVTGAAGSIGSELCRQLIQFNVKKLICLDIWESGLFNLEAELKSLSAANFEIIIANIRDINRIESVFKEYKTDFVFHAAAYKHVTLMEKNPEEAVKNNVFGTKNLVKAALKAKVQKFINISTDKAADPSSIMGVTKLLAERIVKGQNKKNSTKFISVRFGNVLDSQGSVVPIFRKQISLGGPITVTDPKMSRFFMTIPEAVQLVLEAGIMGDGGEIFILDMGTPVNIDLLARLMIQLSGFIPDEEIKIKYIGKRQGEKLNEILNTASEKLEKTDNDKILKVEYEKELEVDLERTLRSLEKITYSKKKTNLVHFLRSVAPSLDNQ